MNTIFQFFKLTLIRTNQYLSEISGSNSGKVRCCNILITNVYDGLNKNVRDYI